MDEILSLVLMMGMFVGILYVLEKSFPRFISFIGGMWGILGLLSLLGIGIGIWANLTNIKMYMMIAGIVLILFLLWLLWRKLKNHEPFQKIFHPRNLFNSSLSGFQRVTKIVGIILFGLLLLGADIIIFSELGVPDILSVLISFVVIYFFIFWSQLVTFLVNCVVVIGIDAMEYIHYYGVEGLQSAIGNFFSQPEIERLLILLILMVGVGYFFKRKR